jgi:hypothetical protein
MDEKHAAAIHHFCATAVQIDRFERAQWTKPHAWVIHHVSLKTVPPPEKN